MNLNDLHVLTTQGIIAIRKTVYYFRPKSLPKLPKSTGEAQDALNKIYIKTLAGENFLFLNDKLSNIVILTCDTTLNMIRLNLCIGLINIGERFYNYYFVINSK